MMRCFVHATMVLTCAVAVQAQEASPVALDEFAGRWTLHDAAGATVGESTIVVQAPGVMLFEQRTIGDRPPQALWFANYEAGGWRQLFVGARGGMREFVTRSAPGAWPLVMGADIVTQDGATTTFRMTIHRVSETESRRVLESSRDAGKTWTPVFDYTYRRASR